MKNEERYFNFPIHLLEGFMLDSSVCLTNIIHYAVYKHSITSLEFGTELERIKSAAAFFNITLGNVLKSFENGEFQYENKPDNSVMVGISKSMFFDFYKNKKTDFDKICLLAFLGIKSILGKKKYFKITNFYLLARMDSKTKTIKNINELSDEVKKFANEYQINKIKKTLIESWGLKHYSKHTRGFYVSFDLTQKELITIAERNRISHKEKERKRKDKELLEQVLNELKIGQNGTRP